MSLSIKYQLCLLQISNLYRWNWCFKVLKLAYECRSCYTLMQLVTGWRIISLKINSLKYRKNSALFLLSFSNITCLTRSITYYLLCCICIARRCRLQQMSAPTLVQWDPLICFRAFSGLMGCLLLLLHITETRRKGFYTNRLHLSSHTHLMLSPSTGILSTQQGQSWPYLITSSDKHLWDVFLICFFGWLIGGQFGWGQVRYFLSVM